MNTGGDAAEQVVRMSLETGEVALRITGQAAKHLAVMLYAILKDQKKTKGRVRLESLCRDGREVKVFTVRRQDVAAFARRVRDYGILYCAVRGQKDGMVDFLVRPEDAAKADRIVERFGLTTVKGKEDVKLEVEHPPRRGRAAVGAPRKKQQDKEGPDKGQDAAKEKTEAILDELLGKEGMPDPFTPGADRPRPSGPTSGMPGIGKDISEKKERQKPSVRKELQEIQEARGRQRQAALEAGSQRQHRKRKRGRGQKVR